MSIAVLPAMTAVSKPNRIPLADPVRIPRSRVDEKLLERIISCPSYAISYVYNYSLRGEANISKESLQLFSISVQQPLLDKRVCPPYIKFVINMVTMPYHLMVISCAD